jgi:hypothetical protein
VQRKPPDKFSVAQRHLLFAATAFVVFVAEGGALVPLLAKKPQAINGVLKISLKGCFAALLQSVQVILYLIFIQFSGQAAKVQRHGGNMAAVVIECAGAAAQYADVALKALQQ